MASFHRIYTASEASKLVMNYDSEDEGVKGGNVFDEDFEVSDDEMIDPHSETDSESDEPQPSTSSGRSSVCSGVRGVHHKEELFIYYISKYHNIPCINK